MKITIIIISTLISLTTFASESDAEVTCKRIEQLKNSPYEKDDKSGFFSGFFKIFHKESANPETTTIKTPLSNLIKSVSHQVETEFQENQRSRKEQIQSLKNYIFLFEPIATSKEEENSFKDYEELSKELEELDENLKELVDENDVNSCIEKYSKYPVKEQYYNAVIDKIKSNKIVQNTLASKEASYKINIAARRGWLGSNWYKVKTTDLNLLTKTLQASDTGNIIIVGHSDLGGTLYDSYGLAIPEKVFSGISPTVKSIVLYSCYGEKVRQRYNLDEILRNSKSIHSERTFVTVKDSTQKDKTPVSAFASFLRGQDLRISSEMRKSINESSFSSTHKNVSRNCSITISSTDSTNYFIAYLNDQFIAHIKSGTRSYNYNCDLLNHGVNNLRVVSRSGKPSKPTQTIELVPNNLSISHHMPFYKNNSFRGALWEFNHYQ